MLIEHGYLLGLKVPIGATLKVNTADHFGGNCGGSTRDTEELQELEGGYGVGEKGSGCRQVSEEAAVPVRSLGVSHLFWVDSLCGGFEVMLHEAREPHIVLIRPLSPPPLCF